MAGIPMRQFTEKPNYGEECGWLLIFRQLPRKEEFRNTFSTG